ncbi:MAG: hypothetical protein ACN6O6_03120 [Pseudomonas sp.]|uniref:hypothetical protein n=1 Tax=Pseudomonas sp. TaxID=306 RepID=UPI003D0C9233
MTTPDKEIVLKNWLLVASAVALLSGCSNSAQKGTDSVPAADEKVSLVGIWAMMPLRNGIANVVEYTADGKSRLHSFNCAEPKESGVELADYRLSEDGKTLHISSPQSTFDLQVLTFKPSLMKLAMNIEGMDLQFTYLKTDRIAPLCALYQKPVVDKSKQTPYQASDFVAAPAIPANANLDRYVGRWANEDGEIQVEVVKDAAGNARLSQEPSDNWRHLFNQVNWAGAELHYQSFAYSEKKSLFTHPYHKSMHPSILTPVDDPEKIQYAFFIGAKRFDYILTRAH